MRVKGDPDSLPSSLDGKGMQCERRGDFVEVAEELAVIELRQDFAGAVEFRGVAGALREDDAHAGGA